MMRLHGSSNTVIPWTCWTVRYAYDTSDWSTLLRTTNSVTASSIVRMPIILPAMSVGVDAYQGRSSSPLDGFAGSWVTVRELIWTSCPMWRGTAGVMITSRYTVSDMCMSLGRSDGALPLSMACMVVRLVMVGQGMCNGLGGGVE